MRKENSLREKGGGRQGREGGGRKEGGRRGGTCVFKGGHCAPFLKV